jgi:hypothetical protein
MVENSTRVPSGDPPRRALDADFNDPRLAEYLYERAHRADADIDTDEPAPLFLSYPLDEASVGYRRRSLGRSLIRFGLVAASVAALAAALFYVDGARDIIASAKASLIGASPVEARAATAAAVQQVAAPAPPAKADQPSREQIAAAYQEAIKGQVVHAAPPSAPQVVPPPAAVPQAAAPAAAQAAAPPAPPPARRLDPGELSAILKRANSLLAIGDIAAARLLLERAAEAEEAEAALLLARTYDPEVLGTKDARSIQPDPAQARIWYRKAAELGSQQAQQRLAQDR